MSMQGPENVQLDPGKPDFCIYIFSTAIRYLERIHKNLWRLGIRYFFKVMFYSCLIISSSVQRVPIKNVSPLLILDKINVLTKFQNTSISISREINFAKIIRATVLRIFKLDKGSTNLEFGRGFS